MCECLTFGYPKLLQSNEQKCLMLYQCDCLFLFIFYILTIFLFFKQTFISEDLCIIKRIQTTKTGISENLGVLNKLYMLSIMNNELYLPTINNSIQDNLSVAIWSGNQEKLSFSKKVRKSQEKLKKNIRFCQFKFTNFLILKAND